MKNRVQELINFQNGEAEVFLPIGATEITVIFKDRKAYLCATADSNEKKKEKYMLSSYDKKQDFSRESKVKFLKEIYIIGAGYFFWYYKKIS